MKLRRAASRGGTVSAEPLSCSVGPFRWLQVRFPPSGSTRHSSIGAANASIIGRSAYVIRRALVDVPSGGSFGGGATMVQRARPRAVRRLVSAVAAVGALCVAAAISMTVSEAAPALWRWALVVALCVVGE